MQKPLISILIPLYNHEKYVISCLNSIILDDYKNKEIVILDDCSTDNSFSIVSEWIKSNSISCPIRLEKNKTNMGICSSLNKLVKFSKGEYIVPLASDDCLISGTISSRLSYLEKNENKMAVFGDCYVIDEQNNVLYNSSLKELHAANISKFQRQTDLKHEIIWNWSIVGPSFLINRKAYDIVGFYDENLEIEDWDFYLRLASKNLIGFIDEMVGLYRIHPNNASRKKTCGEIDTEFELLKIAFKNIKNFRGEYKYLLIKKIIVYVYLIFRKLFVFKKNTAFKHSNFKTPFPK